MVFYPTFAVRQVLIFVASDPPDSSSTEWFETTYKYANVITVICGREQLGGTTFENDKGKIHVNRSKLSSEPGEVVETALTGDDVHLYVSKNHQANRIDCIESWKLPICDVAIRRRSPTVCHLGNSVLRRSRKIVWDPAKEPIVPKLCLRTPSSQLCFEVTVDGSVVLPPPDPAPADGGSLP